MPGLSKFSYLNLVRLLTMSDFGHVSIVVRRQSGIRHFEAVMPTIREASIPLQASLYVVPMYLAVTEEQMDAFFGDKVGLKYSARDAIYGLIGKIPKEDNRYQCAELITDFYKLHGVSLADSYTPSRLVRRLVENEDRVLRLLNTK
jgi:hypothetical protein